MHSEVRAYEGILLASARGCFRNMGLNRSLLGIPASYTHIPWRLCTEAFMGLLGTLAAVYSGRDRDVGFRSRRHCRKPWSTIRCALRSTTAT